MGGKPGRPRKAPEDCKKPGDYQRVPPHALAFLRQLNATGFVTLACDLAGTSAGVMYRIKKKNQDFSDRWDEALERYKERLERECDRRGLEGITKGIYYQGNEVGEERLYSDNLLMFRLKKLDGRYRDNAQASVEINTPNKITITMQTSGNKEEKPNVPKERKEEKRLQ